jgi:tetratricopeptide (TPR) repeat protein
MKTVTRTPVWKNNETLFGHDVKLLPNSAHAHFCLGCTLTSVEDTALARQLLSGMSEPYDPVKLDLGIAELKNALEIFPDYFEANKQLGFAYQRKKEPAKALAAYEVALKLNSKDPFLHNCIGAIHFDAGRYQEALQAFEEALRIFPRYPVAWANLGSTHGRLKDYDRAIQCFSTAAQCEPTYAKAYHLLGIAYQSKGDAAKAALYFEKASQLDRAARN